MGKTVTVTAVYIKEKYQSIKMLLKYATLTEQVRQ